jgi:hypothetical protein
VLVCAVVCPHPPAIVPEIAAGAAPGLDALRTACDEALQRLLDSEPNLLVAVGPAPDGTGVREYGAAAPGSLFRYGLDVPRPSSESACLPLSLSVGAWLLRRSGWQGERCYVAIGEDADAGACDDLGKELATRANRVGLLVLGDGSARRSEKAPGYIDCRAASYDAGVRQALEHGDKHALRNLDATLAAELLAGGRAAWQVLAGAARHIDVEASLLSDQAPYGVAYFVAVWTPR